MSRLPFIIATACLAFLAGCEAPPPDEDDQVDQGQTAQYRLYFDEKLGQAMTARHFEGQLLLAEVEAMFGDLQKLPRDELGNHAASRLNDGAIDSIVVGPDLKTINLVHLGRDGSISSALDFDGDRQVDVLDVRLPDDRRYLFGNELGRMALVEWLKGGDPLCDSRSWSTLPTAGFKCPSSGGGGTTGGDYSGIESPFESICADYRDQARNRFRGGVYSDGKQGYGRGTRAHGYHILEENEGTRTGRYIFVGFRVSRDDTGAQVMTYRETRYFHPDHDGGGPVRVIREQVDSSGHGTRTVIDYNDDGESKTTTSEFETTVDRDGRYPVSEPKDDRDAPAGFDDMNPATNPDRWRNMPPATPSGGATPNPGPFEPDADESWRQYCEATDNSDMRSGVETATEQDLSVFRDPICPTGSPNNSAGNCISLPALRANELEAVTESPDPAGGCGRFEQPGPDGTCGTASRIEMLGRVAWIGQADLGEVLICDPLVCRPPGQ